MWSEKMEALEQTLDAEALEKRIAELESELDERDEQIVELAERLVDVQVRFDAALDGAKLGLWAWDMVTNVVTYNDRWMEMLGYTVAEWPSTFDTFAQLTHPDDLKVVMAQVEAYLSGAAKEFILEIRLKQKSGEYRWVLTSGRIAQRDDSGKPMGMVGVHLDIHPIKHAAAERDELLKKEKAARLEALDAVRLKDLFLATMSHELRTPLNAMIGYQHLMLFSGELNDDNTHMAQRSIANSNRLLNLINNILDISRMATGGLKIVPVKMSPKSLAEQTGMDLQVLAKDKGLTLTATAAPGLPDMIVHDEERLGQIVLNLVNNAIKFTEKGTVDLRITSQDDKLVIEVQDTGIGIPASQKHVIFDDFVQVDGTSTRKQQGAGLGLSIVRRLALLMQGSVTVDSELGKGSTFTVTLPLNLAADMPVAS
jgi:PAS domain S-box-containing protein